MTVTRHPRPAAVRSSAKRSPCARSRPRSARSSSARTTSSSACWSACSPAATCCIEGVPGLAKTLAVKTLARTLAIDFKRIQFTPDLLPADLVGTLIYDPRSGGVRAPEGTGLRQRPARRRDQPRARQGAVGAARGDGGAPGHARRHDLQPPRAVPRPRDPEPDRAGGHLPARRGAGRPLHAEAASSATRPAPRRRRSSSACWSSATIDVRPVLDRARLAELRAACDARLPRRQAARLRARPGRRDARPGGRRHGDLAPLIAFGASPRATIFLARAAKAMALARRPRLRHPRGRQGDRRPTCCATASCRPTRPRPQNLTSDDLVARLLDRVEVP